MELRARSAPLVLKDRPDLKAQRARVTPVPLAPPDRRARPVLPSWERPVLRELPVSKVLQELRGPQDRREKLVRLVLSGRKVLPA